MSGDDQRIFGQLNLYDQPGMLGQQNMLATHGCISQETYDQLKMMAIPSYHLAGFAERTTSAPPPKEKNKKLLLLEE